MNISADEKNDNRIFVVAEIGVNHNGDMNLARQMIESAAECGIDAVKFQTFKADRLANSNTEKPPYQQATTPRNESHQDVIRKLQLSFEQHLELKEISKKCGVEFFSTPYNREDVSFLEKVGVERYKTASADLVDHQLHRAIAATGKPVFIAVGMASINEISRTLEIYRGEIELAEITLLHCVSNYPASPESLNLKIIQTLAERFGFPVGYSDHCPGVTAAMVAVGLGARVIEKHFTLDKKLPGPDHQASCEPSELQELVLRLRLAETMLGSFEKVIQKEELDFCKAFRKSYFYDCDLEKGTVLTNENLKMMRPGTGLTGDNERRIIGKTLAVNVKAGEMLKLEDIIDE